jgi:hypothetical protein
MWSLGKVFCSPEVCRVYIGSFNTAPINAARNPECVGLFEREQEALLEDLHDVRRGMGGAGCEGGRWERGGACVCVKEIRMRPRGATPAGGTGPALDAHLSTDVNAPVSPAEADVRLQSCATPAQPLRKKTQGAAEAPRPRDSLPPTPGADPYSLLRPEA